ncbi:class I adenylate-forming enzyme family protein [Acrocarpospora catenulata]|uniref:class I adenylate-forming enzyme family protein n=1 Tax=Acrocarpospora catenulata TaxID=2836182 RepID=UPI001BD99B6B|nr:class I adenylate-forming enzyme family protein [Acrocarpospora catenulata]
MNLSWWLERTCWETPDNVAVVDADGASTTYRELRALSNRIGNVLAELGVGQDDMVVTAMPDDHVHMAVFWATVGVGAAFSGLNHKLRPERLLGDTDRCRAKVAVVAPEHLELGRLLATCPTVEHVLVAGTAPDGTPFRDLLALAAAAPEELRIAPRSADDLAAVNFTSGTSGTSKGVRFTHGTLSASAWGAIFLGGIDSRTRNLSLVGMYHSGGIHDTVRLAMAGGTVLWSGGWDVERVVRIIETHRPNFAYWIIPTMARDLMRHPRWPGLDLRGLRTYVAGEPVPADVRDALLAKGAQVGNMYGLTEAMPVCVLGPSLYYGEETQVPAGSSGRPNRSFCEVALKDPFTGERLLGDDVEGEVCIRGDVVTPGYLADPERTAEAFDDEGYLHTRDRAYRDPDGWYFIRGRTDDIINAGGEKLSLLEVDEALRNHPDVQDAACVGVAHERFGEVPAAFVAMRHGITEEQARDRLDEHCIRELERWKRPRLYVLVDEVPRTAKRSKDQGAMRTQVDGLLVLDADGVITYGSLRARTGAA